jgi:hypothetical protein
MIEVAIEGLDDAIKMFQKLGSIGEKYAMKALTETAIEATTEMRLSCPVVTNRLRSSIHYETPATKSFTYRDRKGKTHNGKFNENIGGIVVMVGSNVEYAEDVNYGTKPHKIKVKNAKVLAGRVAVSQNIATRKVKYGMMYFGKEVNHPGTKGVHFFEKGYNKALNNINTNMSKNYRLAIDEALKL